MNHFTKLNRCPECGTKLNTCTSFDADEKPPEAGDVTVCGYCGCIGIYNEEGIEKATEPILMVLKLIDEKAYKNILRIQKMILDHKNEASKI